MKIKVFYHVLMIKEWEKIVREQLATLVKSGLYDECESVLIGALGASIDKLEEIIEPYEKIDIVRFSYQENKFEFFTLQIAWYLAQRENFYAVYIHTKGVSFPKHEGGKYWRDYMMHYNVLKWKECRKQLQKGYETCGVKLLDGNTRPAYKVHYSGNFWWAKSSYLKRLPDPCSLDTKDRYQAEFWIGMSDPRAATLCQDFVDYNTKGSFYKGTNYVHTLAWNLPSETEKSVKLLYEQNDNFEHYIVDLGFPIYKDERPKDLEESRKRTSEMYKELANKYASKYVKFENIGVSQNWTQIAKYLDLKDNDILIGADPDERPLHEGWIKAMSDVLRNGRYGVVSLMMVDHWGPLQYERQRKCEGHNIITKDHSNWALIGLSSKLLKGLDEVPRVEEASIYGWLEDAIRSNMAVHELRSCILRDYHVRHTDYSEHSEGSSKLLREWKDFIILQATKKEEQITFEEFLTNNYKK